MSCYSSFFVFSSIYIACLIAPQVLTSFPYFLKSFFESVIQKKFIQNIKRNFTDAKTVLSEYMILKTVSIKLYRVYLNNNYD